MLLLLLNTSNSNDSAGQQFILNSFKILFMLIFYCLVISAVAVADILLLVFRVKANRALSRLTLCLRNIFSYDVAVK